MAANWLHCTMPMEIIPNVDRWPQGPVKTGERVRPPDLWHLARGGELPGWVWFKLARGRDGQWVCTEFSIDHAERPLTSTVLRKIPLSHIVDELLNRQLEYMDRGGAYDLTTGLREFYDGGSFTSLDGSSRPVLTKPEVQDTYLPNSEALPGSDKPRRGPARPPRDQLERFAAAYRLALQTNRHRAIQQAIDYLREDGFEITRSTANRWRQACRHADPPLLDPE
jgi:hypothetical protein